MAAISVLSCLFVRSIPLALCNSSKGLTFTSDENSLSCKLYEAWTVLTLEQNWSKRIETRFCKGHLILLLTCWSELDSEGQKYNYRKWKSINLYSTVFTILSVHLKDSPLFRARLQEHKARNGECLCLMRSNVYYIDERFKDGAAQRQWYFEPYS